MGTVDIVLTMIGFGVAFWQLSRTKSIVELTQESVNNLRNQIVRAEILIQIQTLMTTDSYLDEAIQQTDSKTATRHVRGWLLAAQDLCGLLEAHHEDTTAIVKVLKRSTRAANSAKQTLVTNDYETLAAATQEFRNTAAKAIGDLATYRVKIKLQD